MTEIIECEREVRQFLTELEETVADLTAKYGSTPPRDTLMSQLRASVELLRAAPPTRAA
jgi:hypothetical protein